MSDSTNLLAKKMAVAFLVAFGGSVIPLVLGWLDAPNFDFDRAAVISLIAGAVAAGIRAALAFSPINLVPSDAEHTIGG